MCLISFFFSQSEVSAERAEKRGDCAGDIATEVLVQPRLRALLGGLGYYLRFLNSLCSSIFVT
jgi:hypothetical protein